CARHEFDGYSYYYAMDYW
nr:immunoglobulin heavy chain junction region [Mus musculus]MBK4189184.1 immunoglobulin heavy chain junction region [Mus musculus]